MKNLLSLLVAVVLLPVAANADVLNSVKLIGEIQTIASDVKNNAVGFKMYNAGAKNRILAGLSSEIVDNVQANVLFQYLYAWGDNNYTNKGFDNASAARLATANLVFSNLFDALELTVGRQFYGEEDSAVMYFGPNHYNAEHVNYARVLDAAKLVYSDDRVTATFLAGKIANLAGIDWDYHTDGAPIFGGDVKLKLMENLTAQIYGYDWRNAENYNYATQWWRKDAHGGFYGTKLTFEPGIFLFSAEYARNFGGDRLIKEHNETGYMFKADAAVKASDALTVRGMFYEETPAFFSFGNFTPGLLVGQLMQEEFDEYAYLPKVGVMVINLGFDYRPTKRWTLSLDGYSFQRSGSDRHTATLEADLTAKYAYNQYLELFAGVGYVKYSQSETYGNDYNFTYAMDCSENYKGQMGMLVKF